MLLPSTPCSFKPYVVIRDADTAEIFDPIHQKEAEQDS
jgi:hypothetical protein